MSLRVDRVGPVAQVTLVGPGKGNAMGPDFWRELPRVFQDLDADPDVRAENPPLVVRGVKEILDLDRAPRVEAGLRYVSAWNAAFLPSKDLAEAVRAFSEGRPPQFTGR